MGAPVKSKRSYESPARREQARSTRRAVLLAAEELFRVRGFAATTVGAIAAAAGVSAETVYQGFGSKRAVLAELIDVSIAGDDQPIPVLEREWVEAMRREPNPRQRARILARGGRRILERRALLDGVLRGAAAADPKMAEMWRRTREQRHAGQAALVRILARGGALRPGLTARAATDVLFAIGSPETWQALVVERGWSGDRFERWYGDAIERLVLA
jgi:AcrR family transcriptional regulator